MNDKTLGISSLICLNISSIFPSGENVEIHVWWSSDAYELFSGYPRKIREEFGTGTVPSSVNAADKTDDTFYLLKSNMIYQYTYHGNEPSFTYTFVNTFDFTVNAAINPFSAQPGSPLTSPPSDVTAMVFSEDGELLLAFSYRAFYVFHATTSYWEYVGVIATPTCE